MERTEDLDDGEMEDREREDGGVANIYDEQRCAGGATEILCCSPHPFLHSSSSQPLQQSQLRRGHRRTGAFNWAASFGHNNQIGPLGEGGGACANNDDDTMTTTREPAPKIHNNAIGKGGRN